MRGAIAASHDAVDLRMDDVLAVVLDQVGDGVGVEGRVVREDRPLQPHHGLSLPSLGAGDDDGQ